MKTKCFVPLILCMCIVLAACNATPNGAAGQADGLAACGCACSDCVANQGKAMPNDERAQTEESYWGGWIKDVPHGAFTQADSETFVWEKDGYSVAFTLDKWAESRGSSEYVLHPASNEIPLPLLQASDCVIPFVLTAKTTTKDSAFSTDYNLSGYTHVDNVNNANYYSPRLYGCELSRFETEVESYTENIDSMKLSGDVDENFIQNWMMQLHQNAFSQSIGVNASQTKPGDEQVVLGCYVINNYYSPAFPDGNLEAFPKGSGMMRISLYSSSPQSNENFDIIMY